MKQMVLTLALMLAPMMAWAQDRDIEEVISSQLQAFNDRDIETAWGYASPMIKGFFRTPENFARMVENGYPMVWDNSDAQFRERREVQGQPHQEVLVRGPDGLFYVLDYRMIETPNGWQIDGVFVIPAPDILS